MDGQKDDHENADDQKRMQLIRFDGIARPFNQSFHLRRRLEWRGGFEHDAQALPVRPECFDMVVRCLVSTAMPRIFFGVLQQVAVKLEDVVFAQTDCIVMCKDGLHRSGITGDFLLITIGKGGDIDPRKKPVDFAVRQLRTLDAGGRSDTLDRSNPPQVLHPLRRKPPERGPCPLEFVDLGNGAQHCRRDADRPGFQKIIHEFSLFPKLTTSNYPSILIQYSMHRPILHPFTSN